MRGWFVQLRAAGTEESPKNKKLRPVLGWEGLAETDLTHMVRVALPRALTGLQGLIDRNVEDVRRNAAKDAGIISLSHAEWLVNTIAHCWVPAKT